VSGGQTAPPAEERVDEAATFRAEGLAALSEGDLLSAATMLEIAASKPSAPADARALSAIATQRRDTRRGGGLVVVSLPPDRPFTIEGGPSGRTPADLQDLPPGTYRIVIGTGPPVDAVVGHGPRIAIVAAP
jgi:hypothetical protein